MKFQPSVVAFFVAGALANPIPEPQVVAPVVVAPTPAVTGPDGESQSQSQSQAQSFEIIPPPSATGPDGLLQPVAVPPQSATGPDGTVQPVDAVPPPAITGPDGVVQPQPVDFAQAPDVTDEPFFVAAASDPDNEPLLDPELVYQIAAAEGPGSLPVPAVIAPTALAAEPSGLAAEPSGLIAEPTALALAPLAASNPPPEYDEEDEEEECPANQEWNDCGTACPGRCFMWPSNFCTTQCVAGCQCQSGYVLNANGDCVTQFGCVIGLFTGVGGSSFPSFGSSFPSLGSFPNLFGGAS